MHDNKLSARGNETGLGRHAELMRGFSICALFLLLVFVSSNLIVERSNADVAVFDETVVYEPGFSLGSISFAPNGTLFFNYQSVVDRLVNGSISHVADIGTEGTPAEDYDSIAVAPNGTLYVSVNDNASQGWIYRVVDGRAVTNPYVHRRNGQITRLAFRPDGELYFTDGQAIYSLSEGQIFTRDSFWKANITNITGLAFAQNGTLFVSVEYYHYDYDAIFRRVGNAWEPVYFRSDTVDNWGFDTIAIGPRNEIYFEDNKQYYGRLYKLTPRSNIALRNQSYFLGRMYPLLSNSTVSDYVYNYSGGLRLNLTGPSGAQGACVLIVFHHNYPEGLAVDVKLNGQHIESRLVQTTNYYIYFDYPQANSNIITIELTSPRQQPSGFTSEFLEFIIGAAVLLTLGTVTLVIIKRRKRP